MKNEEKQTNTDHEGGWGFILTVTTFKDYKKGDDAINLHFRQILLAATQSLEMSETGGREISWVAFPVIWVRDHFLLPEYLSNSGIKQV